MQPELACASPSVWGTLWLVMKLGPSLSAGVGILLLPQEMDGAKVLAVDEPGVGAWLAPSA